MVTQPENSLFRTPVIANVDFTEVKSVNNRMMTKVNCLATTFRFLGKEEIKNDASKPKK